MKNVVHLGPYGSKGGMSSVIQNMIDNTPDGWNSSVIKTHSDGNQISKIKIWLKSKRELKKNIRSGLVDVLHVHVTHSISYWRKINLLNSIDKYKIPTIIHVHSGKFDNYCESFFGYPGRSFRKRLMKENYHVVLLEERWEEKLTKWLPKKPDIIRNSAKGIERERVKNFDKIELLMLSRDSQVKGHNFAINILKNIQIMGFDVNLTITGKEGDNNKLLKYDSVEFLGWVSEKKKNKLIAKSHFLLSPSSFEGASMSVIEAINSGLPCLVSPASDETIGVEELVLSLDNSKKWAQKIIQIFDESEYERITKLMEKISERYSPDKIRKDWQKIYDRVKK